MNKLIILSSKYYSDSETRNYGDCILIDAGTDLIIYDCGSKEHAYQVIKYMDENHYSQAKLILSHNDSDHSDGIMTLLNNQKLSTIYTTLLLKYKDEILDKIDDNRKTKKSVSNQIIELYDNIAKLTGAPLIDIYETDNEICSGVSIVGPDKEYMLDSVAKHLDGREGNEIDGETAVNATSIQIEVSFGKSKLLLCGDCSYAAIEDKLQNYQIIQLPHHGKKHQAELIFAKKSHQPDTMYLISDNTGSSNGGSDNLNTKGYRVKNTKNNPNIVIDNNSFNANSFLTNKCLGIGNALFFTRKL